MLGGEVEQLQDARTGVAAVLGGGRGEGDGEGGRNGVVAVAEVLVEDLPADFGAGDDVAGRGPVLRGDRRYGLVLPCEQRKPLRRQLTTNV